MASNEPTRVEIDLPSVIVSNYGRLQACEGNSHSVEDLIARIYLPGTILAVHVIVESTGESRGVCKWIAPDSQYKTPCSSVKGADGVCPLQPDHDKKDAEALQAKMDLAD